MAIAQMAIANGKFQTQNAKRQTPNAKPAELKGRLRMVRALLEKDLEKDVLEM